MRRSLGFALIFAVLLSGCGGGGGGSASHPLPNPGTGGNTPAAAGATFTIVRPPAPGATPSAMRKPGFIPASAQSIVIHIVSVNGAPPDPFFGDVKVQLSTLNPACTTLSNGGLSCNITAKIPIATSVIIQVLVYSSPDGTGSPIASVTMQPIDSTQPTIVVPPVSLGGVPAHILLSPTTLSGPADGTTQQLSFNVWATDANNELIVPPGSYPTPITATISGDANGALTVPAPVLSPGPTAGQSQVTVAYNSAKALTSATIKLSSGSASNTLQVNPLIYSPPNLNALFAGGASTSVTVSESGYSGAFTLGGNGTNFSTTCVPAGCTPASAGGVVSITVTPTANGTGTFTIKDSNAVTASIPFAVTGQTSVSVSQYKVISYSLPSGATSAPVGITAGPDGSSVWVAENGSGNVARVATQTCNDAATPPTCTIDEESASGPSPYGIVSGDDGNVYVTAPVQGAIEGFMLSTACETANPMTCTPITITMPATGTQPSAIVRGGSGIDYITDLNPSAPNIIGMGFPASTALDFYSPGVNPIVIGSPPPSGPAPTPAPSPLFGGIAVSTQPGAPVSVAIGRIRRHALVTMSNTLPSIWMTDNATGHLGTPNTLEGWNAITLSWNLGSIDALVEFAGFNGSGPNMFGGLAFAPNGNLYVVEQAANSIAVVNTANCYSYYALNVNPTIPIPECTGVTHLPIPTPASGASAIIAGPDGNMWFAETTANKIGVVVPSTGVIHELTLPTSLSAPTGLAVGPDGNVWLTGHTNGTIGKVVP